MSNEAIHPDYFRRDQCDGISPPDPTKDFTYAEHIVHARGKRTQYTSVSTDVGKIAIFGETTYRLLTPSVLVDGHRLVSHAELLAELQRVIQIGDKADRQRAIQAKRYATRAREALVEWQLILGSVERKDAINWAKGQIQKYFAKV